MSKVKATWKEAADNIFFDLCCDKQHSGSSFTKKWWNNIEIEFQAKLGESYDKNQLKEEFNSLKRVWMKVNKYRNMEEEWWEMKKKEEEKHEHEKFRNNELPFGKELAITFKDKAASGYYNIVPSSSEAQMQDEKKEVDVCRPSKNFEEGSGDNEEDFGGASAGFTGELAGVNLASNIEVGAPSSSGCHGKRKRNEECGKGKKAKVSTSKQIADPVSAPASLSKDRREDLNKVSEDIAEKLKKMSETSIPEVTIELFKVKEIGEDEELLDKCLEYVANETWRQLFMTLKEKPTVLMRWVRRTVHNPPTYL